MGIVYPRMTRFVACLMMSSAIFLVMFGTAVTQPASVRISILTFPPLSGTMRL